MARPSLAERYWKVYGKLRGMGLTRPDGGKLDWTSPTWAFTVSTMAIFIVVRMCLDPSALMWMGPREDPFVQAAMMLLNGVYVGAMMAIIGIAPLMSVRSTEALRTMRYVQIAEAIISLVVVWKYRHWNASALMWVLGPLCGVESPMLGLVQLMLELVMIITWVPHLIYLLKVRKHC